MKKNNAVNTRFIQKFIGDKLYETIRKNKIVVLDIARKLGYSHPYVLGTLNGKATTLNMDKFNAIASVIGVSQEEMEKIVIEAKKAEIEHTHGVAIPEPRAPETLEEVIRREYGIHDPEAIEDIRLAIEVIRGRYERKRA